MARSAMLIAVALSLLVSLCLASKDVTKLQIGVKVRIYETHARPSVVIHRSVPQVNDLSSTPITSPKWLPYILYDMQHKPSVCTKKATTGDKLTIHYTVRWRHTSFPTKCHLSVLRAPGESTAFWRHH